MQSAILLFLVAIAGIGISLQAGINSRLQAAWAQSPLLAALISFIVGTLGLLVCVLATRVNIPAFPAKITWWHWTGGLLGAFMVLMTIIGVQRIGGAATFSLIIAGQLTASLILDHYGLFGFAQHSVSLPRLAGVLCIAIGVIMIKKF
ncbi:DMT family transporter [Desulfovibrio sp. OttesenSCG-928-C06]|nr:DMT family transporter [Desulfovibrio sp. OttesenSCG-928-C06]